MGDNGGRAGLHCAAGAPTVAQRRPGGHQLTGATVRLMRQEWNQGGERFNFTGDDDLWVFVNGKLAIDLGGVHGPMAGNVDMDAQANNLGLEIGQVYDIDFFFAERHTTQSNFTITTTIA